MKNRHRLVAFLLNIKSWVKAWYHLVPGKRDNISRPFISLLTVGRRGVPYLGYVNHSMYQGTRKRSPSLTKYFVEQNLGTTQWMKVAEKKRKQQRALLKFEKTKYHSKLGLGFSARSNPARYLPECDTKMRELENEVTQLKRIESDSDGRVE